MMDRVARRHLAEGLRRLVAGRITNDEFESRYGARSMRAQDPAVREVYEAAWASLYSDLETYRLSGTRRLDRETRRAVARCILFLRSSRPYEWPLPPRGWAWLAWVPVQLATVGIAGKIRNRRWRQSGEVAVWPFRRWRDYRAALRRPVYLYATPR